MWRENRRKPRRNLSHNYILPIPKKKFVVFFFVSFLLQSTFSSPYNVVEMEEETTAIVWLFYDKASKSKQISMSVIKILKIHAIKFLSLFRPIVS